MRLQRIVTSPEIWLIRDFVTPAEARLLLVAAEPLFERSTAVCDKPGGCEIKERTSASASLPNVPLTETIKRRGMKLADSPSAEDLQVVRYLPGQEFKPHLDAFDDSIGGKREREAYGGHQRDATILVYLNRPAEGGETIFPELGISVDPIPRAALYWRNLRPDGSIDPRLLHGGALVRRGAKYAANLWLRGSLAHPLKEWAALEPGLRVG